MATLDTALELEPDHLSLYALTLDDPVAEGLAGPVGDHLPTTKGARRWRDAVRPGQDEDRAAGQYHHAALLLEEAGYRGYEISNWAQARSREPPQPCVLAAPAERGTGTGSTRVRRCGPALDGGPPRSLRRGAGGLAAEPAARRCRATRRRDGDRRVADPRPPARHRRAARGGARAAARRRLRLGARRGTAHGHAEATAWS